jgi:plasmid maintenance system antidote protein VapI
MSKKSSIHPGEILLTEFMKPLGLTASAEIGGQTSQSRLVVTYVSNSATIECSNLFRIAILW